MILTITETEVFSGLCPKYWNVEGFGGFCGWLALRGEAGDVIPGASG